MKRKNNSLDDYKRIGAEARMAWDLFITLFCDSQTVLTKAGSHKYFDQIEKKMKAFKCDVEDMMLDDFEYETPSERDELLGVFYGKPDRSDPMVETILRDKLKWI